MQIYVFIEEHSHAKYQMPYPISYVLPYENREQDNEFVIPLGILSPYQQLDLVEEISDALHIADGQACSLSLVDMT